MIYCDDEGVGLVDIANRVEIARQPWPQGTYFRHSNALWIPSRQSLCVPDSHSIWLIQLTPPAP
jgi:hypothetical protein